MRDEDVRNVVKVRGPGFELSVEQDYIDVTPSFRGFEIKPGWRHVDSAGHVHRSLETFEWVVTGTYWCDSCRDEHDEGDYRCLRCGEVVTPEWSPIPDTGPEIVRGLRTIRLVLDDGRGYLVRPADGEPTVNAAGELDPEWLERISSREPDWREPVTVRFSR